MNETIRFWFLKNIDKEHCLKIFELKICTCISYPNWIPLEINLGRVRGDIDTRAVDRRRRRPKRLFIAPAKVLFSVRAQRVRRRRDFVLSVKIQIHHFVRIVAKIDYSSLIAKCKSAQNSDVNSVDSF
jgi:hypothetical protein